MGDLLTTMRRLRDLDAGVPSGARLKNSSRQRWRDGEARPFRLLPSGDQLQHTAGAQFRGGLPGGALQRVRAYIDAHIGERISLDDLASQAGVSRFHFARQFRLSTGQSPMAYLRRARVERSKSILKTRETSIAEIAARLGFSDQSHFTRIFGRLVGVPPGSYSRGDEWSSAALAARRA
jgi:AraC family transcriptional regulator